MAYEAHAVRRAKALHIKRVIGHCQGRTGAAEGEAMRGWIRKLRGILGTGTIWGLATATVGLFLGGIISAVSGEPFLSSLLRVGLRQGLNGFLLGCGFAGVLSVMDGRRTLSELSPGRAAVWGAVAGAAFPSVNVLLGTLLGYPIVVDQLVLVCLVGGLITGAVGAGLAAGTVALARRAPVELDSGATLYETERLGSPRDG